MGAKMHWVTKGAGSMAERVIVLWSGGKDSALALYRALAGKEYEVVALVTTVTREYDRISIHGVRTELLRQQAASLGLPLRMVPIPRNCTNSQYETEMCEALEPFAQARVCTAVAGDIFLEDVRVYRERLLDSVGMQGAFPLWGLDTAELALAGLRSGFRSVTSCVDSQVLDSSFAGREFDSGFLSDLPPGVDPCGENGEFHSFVFDGPIFRCSVPYVVGDVVLRDGRFYYCDLLPDGADTHN